MFINLCVFICSDETKYDIREEPKDINKLTLWHLPLEEEVHYNYDVENQK
jgi:hypothetical protein